MPKGPRQRKGRAPQGNQIFTDLPSEQISWDIQKFSEMVRSHGIRMVHMRAIPDPSGMTGRNDMFRSGPNQPVSDGYIYKEAGIIEVLFQSNTTSEVIDPEAIISSSSAYVTIPSTYEGTDKPVLISEWDKFCLLDVEPRVVGKQYIEAHSTGVDRLQYPATCVEHLIDANGVEYFENRDFKITADGNIQWLGQNRPGFDVKIGRGVVYSIRYRYVPFFIVARIVHEIRVSQVTNPATFDRSLERMPYQVMVVREKVFQDKNRDPMRHLNDARYEQAPSSGGTLGPK